MLFFDRQWLLQILYNNVKHKDRILVGERVQEVIPIADGIEVRTGPGSLYRGHILIGADGIHSSVRREMFRLAHETKPGHFPVGEEDRVPCYYQCSFGIAQDVDHWQDGDECFTIGDGKNFLVAPGPRGRVYWFLFRKLPEVRYGKDIPRYTKEDEAAFVKENFHLAINENLSFGKLYEKRISSSLTPLHEVVFKKWYFDRILVIGDAVHKASILVLKVTC